MAARWTLMVILMMTVCSGFSWAADDTAKSIQKIADDYIASVQDYSSKKYNSVSPTEYDHVTAFHYSEDHDLGDGWTGGAAGPTVFVDRNRKSVVGVRPPSLPTPPPIFVGGDMSDELEAKVTAHFRETSPDWDIANYNFFITNAGGISYLYVERKYFDRDIYNCKCALIVENRTSRILGSTLSLDYGDSMYYPKKVKE